MDYHLFDIIEDLIDRDPSNIQYLVYYLKNYPLMVHFAVLKNTKNILTENKIKYDIIELNRSGQRLFDYSSPLNNFIPLILMPNDSWIEKYNDYKGPSNYDFPLIMTTKIENYKYAIQILKSNHNLYIHATENVKEQLCYFTNKYTVFKDIKKDDYVLLPDKYEKICLLERKYIKKTPRNNEYIFYI